MNDELKACIGCGHLSNDPIPEGKACCPDSKYLPIKQFIEDWHKELVRVKMELIELKKKHQYD